MKIRACAPLVVFAFNRPAHLEQTLTALAANTLADGTSVRIFVDGPRNTEDVPKVDACIVCSCCSNPLHSHLAQHLGITRVDTIYRSFCLSLRLTSVKSPPAKAGGFL